MCDARIRIDLNAIAKNYRHFQNVSEGQAGAVVKANAYGLGVLPVVERLEAERCKHYFVANLTEANVIRSVTKGEIFVFSPPLTDGIKQTHAHGCVPVINTRAQLEEAKLNPHIPVAAHVDTGMARLGLADSEFEILDLQAINLRLLMTHLACADVPSNTFNELQVTRFESISRQLPNIPTSIGNSAGILNGAQYQGDLVRPGIGLYGANPYSDRKNSLEIVARCEAKVVSIRELDAGESVGYGQMYTTQSKSVIAVIGMGYADGLPHVLSNVGHFAFGEKLLPIRGKVSMDLTQVDVTQCPELKVGDWLEFFGDTIDVDDVAKSARSFGYEFLTGIGARVERQYVSL